MAQFELTMPKMGESVAEATIIKWTKNEGDSIKIDETVLEIATDKVDSEIPSPFEGKLIKKLFNENDVVQVGAGKSILIDALSLALGQRNEGGVVRLNMGKVVNSESVGFIN